MMAFRALILACLLSVGMGATSVAAAEENDQDPAPEVLVAEELFLLMQSGDWVGAAELFDPGELRKFREMLTPMLEIMKQDEEASAGFAAMLGIEDPAALGPESSDAEFFAAFMGGVMGRANITMGEGQIVGSVAESPDLRHVVARVSAGVEEVSLTQMEVVSVRRRDGRWWALLSGEMRGMAEALRSRFEAAREMLGATEEAGAGGEDPDEGEGMEEAVEMADPAEGK